MDFSDSRNWKAISTPDIYGRADKTMPQALGMSDRATASTTQIFQLGTAKIIQVFSWV